MNDNYDVELDDVELPDGDENLEEGNHDTEGAEKQSIDSVDKTDDSVKKASARKGDNTKQDPMPKTKAGMLNAMVTKMTGLDKQSLSAMYSKMSEEFGELEAEDSEELEENSYDFSEELTNLVESEATLSDEFKAKSAVIFETAIKTTISQEVDRLEDEYQTKLAEELEATRDDLVEKVDSYLNYVVETWMQENEVAIEQGLRTEIAEDFMGNLKDLFVESYIEVPESKVDLVDELADQVESLEEKLDERTSMVLEMSEELEAYKRAIVVAEHSEGMAETEAEKLESLVQSLDFEDEESFSEKVKTVKESYFKKSKPSVDAETEDMNEDWSGEEEKPVSASMQKYIDALNIRS